MFIRPSAGLVQLEGGSAEGVRAVRRLWEDVCADGFNRAVRTVVAAWAGARGRHGRRLADPEELVVGGALMFGGKHANERRVAAQVVERLATIKRYRGEELAHNTIHWHRDGAEVQHACGVVLRQNALYGVVKLAAELFALALIFATALVLLAFATAVGTEFGKAHARGFTVVTVGHVGKEGRNELDAVWRDWL